MLFFETTSFQEGNGSLNSFFKDAFSETSFLDSQELSRIDIENNTVNIKLYFIIGLNYGIKQIASDSLSNRDEVETG